jgi:ketosteroid isomerase-like protein
MSQENVERFKRATAALNRGDIEEVLKDLHPAVEWHAFLEELLGGEGMVYSGHAGVRDFFREFGETFDELYWEYPDVRDLGDRLLAIGTFRARGRGSGIEAEVPLGVVVTFEDDLVTVVWSTDDPSEALAVVGLPE